MPETFVAVAVWQLAVFKVSCFDDDPAGKPGCRTFTRHGWQLSLHDALNVTRQTWLAMNPFVALSNPSGEGSGLDIESALQTELSAATKARNGELKNLCLHPTDSTSFTHSATLHNKPPHVVNHAVMVTMPSTCHPTA